MEIQSYIDKRKELYDKLLIYIESSDSEANDYEILYQIIKNQEILENTKELIYFIKLLTSIIDNYHRNHEFFHRIEKILLFLKDNLKQNFSNVDIYEQFKNNKRILLFLIQSEVIIFDENIVKLIKEQEEPNEIPYSIFFIPEINKYENNDDFCITDFSNNLDDYEKKRQLGENDSYICTLIRQDLIKEFVQFVNRTNFSLSSTIVRSPFETNRFLNKCQDPIELIEYASFFGSIQIIQYLQFNNVKYLDSMWSYVIHSKNAELIHFLEENEVRPYNNSYLEIFKESILCHHNDIAVYIKDNLMTQKDFEFKNAEKMLRGLEEKPFKNIILNSFNYYFYPNDISSLISNTDNIYKFKIQDFLFSFTKISIPSSVTKIADFAFSGCSTLKEITIPISVVYIGNDIFNGCSSLEVIHFLSSSIPSNMCLKCSKLKIIELTSSLKTISDCAFKECSSLTNIKIPSSCNEIGKSAFSFCSSLKEFEIPSSIKEIKDNTFDECKSLIKIVIPSSVIEIGECVFDGCSSLKQINIPSSVTKIGNYAFCECKNLEEIIIPSSVIYIGYFAFHRCKMLKKISISPSITKIKKFTFCKCKSIKKIEIPSSVTTIEQSAFKSCSKLFQLTIPSSVTLIDEYAFDKCTSLIEIEIPSSVTKINDYVFNKCTSLYKILIPSSVTKIGKYAFCECNNLIDISIPSSVTEIGDNAFHNCSSLKQISISPSMTEINKHSFSGCSSLVNIYIPLSIKVIKDFAFYECSALKKIVIPSSVNEIGNGIFDSCESLVELSVPSSLDISKLVIDKKVKIIKY